MFFLHPFIRLHIIILIFIYVNIGLLSPFFKFLCSILGSSRAVADTLAAESVLVLDAADWRCRWRPSGRAAPREAYC